MYDLIDSLNVLSASENNDDCDHSVSAVTDCMLHARLHTLRLSYTLNGYFQTHLVCIACQIFSLVVTVQRCTINCIDWKGSITFAGKK